MKQDPYELFRAAVQRIDHRYDGLLYGRHRFADPDVRAKLGEWAHERWQALFREWMKQK